MRATALDRDHLAQAIARAGGQAHRLCVDLDGVEDLIPGLVDLSVRGDDITPTDL